jgi:cytochrome c biogenesis protein CcmG, thiol:disulfide interchange protein DsbE
VRLHLQPLFAMTPRRFSIGFGGVALLALIVVGLLQLAGRSQTPAALPALTPTQVRARLSDSPPLLAALHAQANQLLPGGKDALHTRLAVLHGRPVVINKWASWCQPCRSEFGAFQRASVNLGRRVAFIGIDSGDTSRSSALEFLRSFPVSYPSYFDPSSSLGEAITDSSSMPVTVFYDARGGEFIHQGPYLSVTELERDINRYALEA